jgi:hypothetical protein
MGRVLPNNRFFEFLNPDPPVTILLPGALNYLQQAMLRNHTRVLPQFFLGILTHVCNSISNIPGVLFSGPEGMVDVVMTEEDVVTLNNRLVYYYVGYYFCFVVYRGITL